MIKSYFIAASKGANINVLTDLVEAKRAELDIKPSRILSVTPILMSAGQWAATVFYYES
jgi:hypothetical protein